MLKIGLTGGIGSGKSTIADLFAQHGVPVLDMDVLAREVVMPGQPALREIKNLFGEDICTADDELKRSKLRRIIFTDSEKRQQLEAIVHPRIRERLARQLDALSAPYCLIVIPLLFETGRQDSLDRILVVDSPVDRQISRTMQRDNISEEQARQIMATQVDRQTRLSQADDIISNAGDIRQLSSQVAQLHRQYLALAQGDKQISPDKSS